MSAAEGEPLVADMNMNSHRSLPPLMPPPPTSFTPHRTASYADSVWDLEAGIEKSRLRGHTGGVLCLALSSDNKTLISGSLDQSIM